MGTSNFSIPTLSKHYTICMDQDGNNDDLDWMYEDEIGNIQSELETAIKGFEGYPGRWINQHERVIGSIDIEYFDHDNREWDTMTLYVTSEIGYYQGAMIDVYMDDIEGRSYSTTVQRKVDRYINRIEQVLERYTITLRRVAMFSNGETMYERV